MGDATRLAIIQKLANGPLAVHDLAKDLPVSRPAVSQHLRILKDAGLIADRKAGTRRLYQLNAEGVAMLRAHFDKVWDHAMRSFQAAAEKTTSEETNDRSHGRRRRT